MRAIPRSMQPRSPSCVGACAPRYVHAAGVPAAGTRTRAVIRSSSASATASKPAPRFALDAGAETVNGFTASRTYSRAGEQQQIQVVGELDAAHDRVRLRRTGRMIARGVRGVFEHVAGEHAHDVGVARDGAVRDEPP